MRINRFPIWVLLSVLGLLGCKTAYQTQAVQYKDYRIKQAAPVKNELSVLLQPYSESVNQRMSDVVAVAAIELEKRQPEGTLGNLMADAMRIQSAEKYQMAIDAAFVNYGGIRLSSIPAGNITRGKIFELAPFDNLIVLLQIKGTVLQEFLNLVASRGGWPCSGVQFQIQNKKAINVVIANAALDPNKTYTISLVDYVANGGDDCEMLKPIPQTSKGYLFRDAILEYLAKQQAAGKQISATKENRVSNVQ